eukprot:14817414-Heterocapsa_arctica.AAC.1
MTIDIPGLGYAMSRFARDNWGWHCSRRAMAVVQDFGDCNGKALHNHSSRCYVAARTTLTIGVDVTIPRRV